MKRFATGIAAMILYIFDKDTKPGDVTGDGDGGVRHVVKAEQARQSGRALSTPLSVGFADHPPAFRQDGPNRPMQALSRRPATPSHMY